MCLFAYRLFTDEMKANQLCLYFSALAFTLVEALRLLDLKGTEWAEAQVDTNPPQAFQDRRHRAHQRAPGVPQLSAACPWKALFAHAY
jgi:hypothetical protein